METSGQYFSQLRRNTNTPSPPLMPTNGNPKFLPSNGWYSCCHSSYSHILAAPTSFKWYVFVPLQLDLLIHIARFNPFISYFILFWIAFIFFFSDGTAILIEINCAHSHVRGWLCSSDQTHMHKYTHTHIIATRKWAGFTLWEECTKYPYWQGFSNCVPLIMSTESVLWGVKCSISKTFGKLHTF